jgi:hypothetical protein
MDSNNITRSSEELTSPRFDTVATNRAHPVVPLSNTAGSTRGRGILSAMRRVRPAVLVMASVLVAAVIVGAATAIYRHQQSSLAPGSAVAPVAILATEEASSTSLPAAKRRANPEAATPPVPLRRVAESPDRKEVLETIRELMKERSRSRGERDGKHRDRERGRHKRGRDRDGDDN